MQAPKSFSAIRFFFVSLLLVSTLSFAQSGKDGNKTISSANTVVNDYTVLLADANAGSTALQVASNALNIGFPAPLAAGDLVLIIQMQGVGMVTSDGPSYGNVFDYATCGNYEFVEVLSVSGPGTINLSCALEHSYTAFGKVQVLRVPRYSTLLVNGGSGITGLAWNGSFGGVVAIEVTGTTTINGTIDVSGKGFRGGGLYENNSLFGVLNYRWNVDSYGGEKGESVFGAQSDYDNNGGRYCNGAPANGGGGGNGHNGGGGGGSNSGSLTGYTGKGVPDNSNASWAAAWNLEGGGFASTSSPGGGKGGYTFSSDNQNALTVGPTNAAWGGDSRRETGGRGGKPLDYSTGKIFMGGGGGAGDQNDSKGGIGGNGGGIVIILSYDAVTGSGNISANGANGVSALTSNATDGSGGGGGGGAVIINNSSPVSSITINANGGNGGSQSVQIFTEEAEGTGGGGGGGYIGISSGGVPRNVNGGPNGTTNSFSLSEFPPNGATKGNIGIPNGFVNAFRINTQPVNICGSSSATLSFTTQGSPPAGVTYSWYNQSAGGAPLGTGLTFTTPVLTSTTTYYVAACPGTRRIPIQVNVGGAVSAAFSSNVVCAGTPTVFAATGSVNITSWSFDFGDSSPLSPQQNPSHTYATGGTYTAILTVSDGTCSSTISQTVNVSNGPSVNFTSSAGTNCGPLAVQFTNSSSGASSYSWNFGDASAASTQTSPAHTYASAGSYTVVLTATGSGCTRTLSQTISVGPPPLSSFAASITSACENDTIRFANNSNGNGSTITGYTWNFGDGSPASSATNPFHIYTTSGTFNVTLTAATAGCDDDTTISISISPSPAATFSANFLSGCTPLNVTFNNTTSGTPSYNWNFGDGGTSTQNAPSHVYTTPGTYSVTLIATQGTCADTLRIPNMIQVANKPLASYNASAIAGCMGDAILFTNTSTGTGITGYTWNFGDGSPTSSSPNPSHIYSAAGTFNVMLTANAPGCNDDTTIAVTISPAPVAGFNASVTSGCNPLNVTFTNTTTGTPSSYTWNFGDGGTSNNAAPSHSYTAAGNYTVTLVAHQGSCSDTVQITSMINVAAAPHAVFTSSLSSACLGDQITFTNSSSGASSGYTWNFGDGSPTSSLISPSHVYSSAGTFTVTLTANNPGCNDDTTISINVSPSPVAGFNAPVISGCSPLNVSFTNSTTGAPSYNWNFGDGGTSTLQFPSHNYTTPGIYSVTLIATQGSCADTMQIPNMISVTGSPLASFSASTSSVCLGDSVSFTNSSTGNGSPLTAYDWTFGDGGISTGASPSHLYSSAGTFTVMLSSHTANCADDTSITVVVNPVPSVVFSAPVTSGCDSLFVQFSNTTSGASTYLWDFGDGNTETANAPSHIYNAPGNYSVFLTATGAEGCSSSRLAFNLITIHATPLIPFTASQTNVCKGNCISFSPQGAAGILTFDWNFPGANPSTSSLSNPSNICYPGSGPYNVTLQVSDGFCTSMRIENSFIEVVDCSVIPRAEFRSSDSSFCAGTCIDFVDLSLNATSWNWFFPGGNPSSSTVEDPLNICYSSSGVYDVTLIVENPAGKDTVVVTSIIDVSNGPVTPTFTQTGDTLLSSSSFQYQWYYNNIPISGATSQLYVATLTGNYSVATTDVNGCVAFSVVKNVTLIGIEEVMNSLSFYIFPNPANDKINILLNSKFSRDILISFNDALGRNILSDKISLKADEDLFTFDLNSFSAGVYFISIETEKNKWVRRLVKQ